MVTYESHWTKLLWFSCFVELAIDFAMKIEKQEFLLRT